ncbi:hypothetical protein V3G39_16030 [Dermatophilaceae bacterium Sec6.4]
MTYAFTQDVPIDTTAYDKIVAELGPDPAPGFVVHLAIARPEGGLRYIDVWDTEADFEKFAEERLHPAVHPVLHAAFGENMPPEPERVPLDVIHVWKA